MPPALSPLSAGTGCRRVLWLPPANPAHPSGGGQDCTPRGVSAGPDPTRAGMDALVPGRGAPASCAPPRHLPARHRNLNHPRPPASPRRRRTRREASGRGAPHNPSDPASVPCALWEWGREARQDVAGARLAQRPPRRVDAAAAADRQLGRLAASRGGQRARQLV
eukprot:scaffold3422_cov298-Prasinococcus_capsulatus_cf.AAC.2